MRIDTRECKAYTYLHRFRKCFQSGSGTKDNRRHPWCMHRTRGVTGEVRVAPTDSRACKHISNTGRFTNHSNQMGNPT